MCVSTALPAGELICLPLRSILPLRPVSLRKDDDLRSPMVHQTWGTPRVFLRMFLAAAESRFDNESTLPPQAGTPQKTCGAHTSRWAACREQFL